MSREVISLAVDFTKKSTVFRKPDGSIWLHYCDVKGEWRDIPITLIGLGDLLGSRVTLAGLQANLVEPKDINRLICSAHPTGRILWQDDFSLAQLQWGADAGTVSRDTTNPFIMAGTGNVKLVTGTAAGDQARMEKSIMWRKWGRWAIEFWWTPRIAADTTLRDMHIWDNRIHDGEYKYLPCIRYLKNLGAPKNVWQISRDGGATWEDVMTQVIDTVWGVPHYCKFVFDMVKREYVRLISDYREVDLSGIKFHRTPDTTMPRWQPKIGITTDVDLAATAYIDAVILTYDEP